MKSYLRLLLVGLCALCASVVSLHAQDSAPVAASAGISADQIVQWLTPVLVPLLLAGFKKVMPSMPSWVIPLLAPVLGVVIELINGLVTSHGSNLWVAAALGLAGVGLREVKEAIKPAPNGGWPVT